MSWDFFGEVASNLVVEPAIIDFGGMLRVLGEIRTSSALVRSTAPLRQLKAVCEDPRLETLVVPADDDGVSWRLEVRPKAQALESAHEARSLVRLMPALADGTELPVTEIPVHCVVAHDVEANPKRLALGVHATGREVHGTLGLSSATSRAFVVQSASATPNWLSVAVQPDGSESVACDVTARVVQGGSLNGELTLTVRDAVESEPYRITVPGLVIGTRELSGEDEKQSQ